MEVTEKIRFPLRNKAPPAELRLRENIEFDMFNKFPLKFIDPKPRDDRSPI